MTMPPCYDRKTRTDCTRRAVGCRSSCPEWKKYETAKAGDDAKRDKERKERRALWEHYSAVRDHNEKQRTKRQKEGRK